MFTATSRETTDALTSPERHRTYLFQRCEVTCIADEICELSDRGSGTQQRQAPVWGGWFLLGLVENLELLLVARGEALFDLRHRHRTGEGPVQELADARTLHEGGAAPAHHLAEAVIAEDDRVVFHLSIGHDELAVCKEKRYT
ncbi:hypothetical protein AVEN_59948-1 [Araneus ventricosus]|uniref:Uncharacterized protein n=1 Tax=Araneus ventricosus TaxID=182803 RepID=A0A4Y2LWB0_ARAVE|nr:hypothetical protein AVEN_59948-1 [Araneus ventricosus]